MNCKLESIDACDVLFAYDLQISLLGRGI